MGVRGCLYTQLSEVWVFVRVTYTLSCNVGFLWCSSKLLIPHGKMTSRTTFSFRTPGAVVRYDSRTKEKKESVRNGVRNGKMK